jgi:hypothetical protein
MAEQTNPDAVSSRNPGVASVTTGQSSGRSRHSPHISISQIRARRQPLVDKTASLTTVTKSERSATDSAPHGPLVHAAAASRGQYDSITGSDGRSGSGYREQRRSPNAARDDGSRHERQLSRELLNNHIAAHANAPRLHDTSFGMVSSGSEERRMEEQKKALMELVQGTVIQETNETARVVEDELARRQGRHIADIQNDYMPHNKERQKLACERAEDYSKAAQNTSITSGLIQTAIALIAAIDLAVATFFSEDATDLTANATTGDTDRERVRQLIITLIIVIVSSSGAALTFVVNTRKWAKIASDLNDVKTLAVECHKQMHRAVFDARQARSIQEFELIRKSFRDREFALYLEVESKFQNAFPESELKKYLPSFLQRNGDAQKQIVKHEIDQLELQDKYELRLQAVQQRRRQRASDRRGTGSEDQESREEEERQLASGSRTDHSSRTEPATQARVYSNLV